MLPRFLNGCPDTCETCRFWQPDQHFEDNVLGECRLKMVRRGRPRRDPAEEDALADLARRPWPLTESRDWCVEWRRDAA